MGTLRCVRQTGTGHDPLAIRAGTAAAAGATLRG